MVRPDPTEQPVASSDDTRDVTDGGDAAAGLTLEEALDGVEGWFSPEQVDRVVRLGPPRCPRAGGSSRSAASGAGRRWPSPARRRPGVEIVAIDPHAGNDRGPQEIEGFEDEAGGRLQGVPGQPGAGRRARSSDLVRKFSHDALDDVVAPIDLLHIDGAHRFGPASDDIKELGGEGHPWWPMVIHDSFSSVGVTLAIGAPLLASGRWRYAGRSRSLAEYRHEPVRGTARVTNVFRQLAQLPWFLRNVAIKALIVAKLPQATRILGHEGGNWPY